MMAWLLTDLIRFVGVVIGGVIRDAGEGTVFGGGGGGGESSAVLSFSLAEYKSSTWWQTSRKKAKYIYNKYICLPYIDAPEFIEWNNSLLSKRELSIWAIYSYL